MGAHRYQSTWRSIIFNRVYDDSGLVDDPAHQNAAYRESDYRLESLDPTPVQSVDYRELRQHLEGAEPNEAFEGVRLITGRGLVLGSSAADLEDKTWAMYEAFSPAACREASKSLTPKGVLPYDFKRASASAAKALRFYCRPALGRPVIIGRMREGFSRPFLFQLVALDPFAYDQSETSQTFALVTGETVVNPGNVYTRPVIRIITSAAGASNLTITNTTTGQALVFDATTMGAGSILDLDVARGTAKNSTGTIDRYPAVTSGFVTSLYLVPGNNVIALTNTTNVSSVRYTFRGAYA